MTPAPVLCRVSVAVIVGVALGSCSHPPVPKAPDSTSATAPTTALASVTLTAAQNPSLGLVLADPDGLTLYHYSRERNGEVRCVGSCTDTWTPLLVPPGHRPVTGPGVVGVAGVTERPDGSEQATFDGYPLYRYRHDADPGEASGEGVGGQWTVIQLPPAGPTSVPIHPLAAP